jgi:methyltransferase
MGDRHARAPLDDPDHRPSGAPLIRAGPYRYLSHPNYLVVTGEIAVLPLVFGLWEIAVVFTILNLGILAVRIPQENKALRGLRG